MIFRSDNVAGMAPSVLAALGDVNPGYQASYGHDAASGSVKAMLTDLFGCDLEVLMCGSGTAANAIGIGAALPSYGHCYAHELAHIRVDECNAVPMVSGGGNLWPVPGALGKMDVAGLRRALGMNDGSVHQGKPSVLSITQATERGTIYSVDEIGALSAAAHDAGMVVHMDGARFANALVALGCSPAEMSWRSGVDLLTFGSAKNGTFSAEALVIFDPNMVEAAGYLHKRMAQLSSKMRFQSAQMQAYLRDDLWLHNARHANAMAARLVRGIEASGIGRLDYPPEANMIFWRMPAADNARFEASGHHLVHDDEGDEVVLRLVASFDVRDADVDDFLHLVRPGLRQNEPQARAG